MPFSSVYQLEKCDHITQSDTAQTLPNRNLHQLKVRLLVLLHVVPATKFSSTTRNLPKGPKTDDSLRRLPTVPEATIDHYSGQTTQQIIALGKLQVVKLNPITGTTQSNNPTLSRCKLWSLDSQEIYGLHRFARCNRTFRASKRSRTRITAWPAQAQVWANRHLNER